MSKPVAVLLAMCSFMSGIVLGFLLAPIKRGMNLNVAPGCTRNFYGNDSYNEEESKLTGDY
ncbi:MAG TPA: hypothetical protein VJX95_00400 [Oscillospiraceae bacterium]|nr:hypothetical protein [Oscillospiraceae bacterium]